MKDTKYLLRKRSGSRNQWRNNNLDYDRVDYKGSFDEEPIEDKFPKAEGMNTKNDKNAIDTSLVEKWLHSKVGENFDDVYSEYLSRVQPKYLELHRNSIYRYVHKAEEIKIEDGVVKIPCIRNTYAELKQGFYIQPDTNILCRVTPSKKRMMSHKEGKKLHAEIKTSRNKNKVSRKKMNKERGDKAISNINIIKS